MRLTFLIVLSLVILCPCLSAMDATPADCLIQLDENTLGKIDGLSLVDALDLWEKSKVARLDYDHSFCDALIVSGFLSLVPAVIPGLLFSILGCIIGSATHGACITGYACISFPVVAFIIALISPLWVSASNCCIDAINQKKENVCADIRLKKSFNDDHDRSLYDREVPIILPLIYRASPELLQKLNLNQALMIETVDESIANKLLTREVYSKDINVLLFKLMHLKKMTAPELSKELSEMPELFKSHPRLFEVLIQKLPPQVRQDAQTECLSCLGKLLPPNPNSLTKLDTLLDAIAQGGSLIALTASDLITLRTDKKEILISRDKLTKISSCFAICADSGTLENSITLKEYPEAIFVFEQMANEKMPQVKDLLQSLRIANHYLIEPLKQACEEYACKHGIDKSIIEQWAKESGLVRRSSFADLWEFSKTLNLDKFKEHKLEELKNELHSFKNYRPLFEKIAVLDKQEQQGLFDGLSLPLFYEELKKGQQLKYYADIACEFDIQPFKKIIFDFCNNKDHEVVVHRIWSNIPAELKTGV